MAFRDGPFQDRKLPLSWLATVVTLVAAGAALVILIADRKDTLSGGYGAVRRNFDSVVAPMGEVLETPVRWAGNTVQYVRGYFFAVSENRHLHTQVRELQRWRDAAVALKNVNDRYAALLKLKTEPEFPMVTGRSVVDVRGPFSNARLIDVGAAEGVKVGNPVLGEHGVIGRVVGITDEASRVLLLTDVESRTPVLVDRSNARAILTGDGGGYPKLEYLRGRDPIRAGDLILTSGDGGLYPRGLPVGLTVKDVKGNWRVRLFSDNGAIDFVRVLLFQDFSQAIPPAAFKSAMPPLNPAQKADLQAALQRAATAPKPAAGATAAAATTAAPAPTVLIPPPAGTAAAKAPAIPAATPQAPPPTTAATARPAPLAGPAKPATAAKATAAKAAAGNPAKSASDAFKRMADAVSAKLKPANPKPKPAAKAAAAHPARADAEARRAARPEPPLLPSEGPPDL